MANCEICGAKINFVTTGSIPLPTKDGEGVFYVKVCSNCEDAHRKVMYADWNLPESDYYERKQALLEMTKNAPEEIIVGIKQALEKKEEEISIEKEKCEVKREKEAKQILKKDKILTTTGYNFEGYNIARYLNIVHGEVVLGTGFISEISTTINDVFGTTSSTFEGKMAQAKEKAQEQLIFNSIARGANAVIGVDFDISTLSNNILVVSANGTAVVIEKIEKE